GPERAILRCHGGSSAKQPPVRRRTKEEKGRGQAGGTQQKTSPEPEIHQPEKRISHLPPRSSARVPVVVPSPAPADSNPLVAGRPDPARSMAEGFGRWESDPLFPAAECVQDSADRFGSFPPSPFVICCPLVEIPRVGASVACLAGFAAALWGIRCGF
uniref:Uncharacterized protein n=1 Tax=Aegilops tauschii subsp. strangulata TaxID=200361 RepID=A0A452Z7S1_AEGTS